LKSYSTTIYSKAKNRKHQRMWISATICAQATVSCTGSSLYFQTAVTIILFPAIFEVRQ